MIKKLEKYATANNAKTKYHFIKKNERINPEIVIMKPCVFGIPESLSHNKPIGQPFGNA
jgi:hypothetical protein